jgi:hypothetical protein
MRKNRFALAAMAVALVPLTAVLVPSSAAAGPHGTAADQPFNSAVFQATHNSYSGNVAGAKNSLTYQLDFGVRQLELDVHDNDYGTGGDYSIGHDEPGHEVDHAGGNPASNRLGDWLDEIASWSEANPGHAPLVVLLDIKDDLTDNASHAEGNLAALNDKLAAAFGTRLLRAEDYPAGSSVDELRGRVLPVLSGDSGTRTAYKRDVGHNPAVAMDSRGNIVEVHDSGSGTLWYWTGRYAADGRVTWLRHSRYDTGVTPAVAMDDNGNVVEVHKSEDHDTLWYRVGRLQPDGEISWSASRQYDEGVLPTVRFTDPVGGELREIHRSENNDQNWDWHGTLNTGDGTVDWSGNAETDDARYEKATATTAGRGVHVYTGADGPTPEETLRYDTSTVDGGRIRYEQTTFVEYQDGDSTELQRGALFWGAAATEKRFMLVAREFGALARGWDFDSADLATNPLAHYPSTNQPWTHWYQTMMNEAGAVK